MSNIRMEAFEKHGAFGMYVRRLHDVITTQLEESLIDAGCSLKGTTTSIVWLLRNQGPLSLTDISKQLRYSHQLATQRIGWLEKRKLVHVSTDRTDKRRKIIKLTKAGLRECSIFEKHIAALEQMYTDIFTEIDVDAMAVVRSVEAALLSRTISERIIHSREEAA